MTVITRPNKRLYALLFVRIKSANRLNR